MDFMQSFTPNGPTITVFRGWQSSSPRLKNTTVGHVNQATPLASLVLSRDTSKSNRHRKFRNGHATKHKFITSTTAERSKDKGIGILVPKHVRNEVVQKSRHKRDFATRSSKGSFKMSTYVANENCDATVPRLFGFPTALCVSEYPILMQPHFHQLLDIYVRNVTKKLFPIWRNLQFHPSLGPDWFQFALADEAMLHGLLYAGAIYSALSEGKTESKDTVYHLSQIVSIVKKRLDYSGPVQESTIGTLCCLALGEATTGHLDLWHVHMRGLKQILEARGGISSLPKLLQTKVRRTDIAAAAEHAEVPYLDFYRSNQPPIWSVLPKETQKSIQDTMISILTAYEINSDLIANMTELALFTEAIQFTKSQTEILLDPDVFCENMHWIQFKFLSFQASLKRGSKEQDIDCAFRMGGLLYIKAILEQPPSSATGCSILLRRLQQSLDKIPVTKIHAPLLLWLTLVGALLSSQNLQRTWFVAHLALLTAFVPVFSFDDTEILMGTMMGLRDSLGSQLEKLWMQVMVVRERSSAYQAPKLAFPPIRVRPCK